LRYYLEILKKVTKTSIGKTYEDYIIETKDEFPTKAKAMTALEKKEINPNQKKRIHLCTHDDKNPQPCEIIN